MESLFGELWIVNNCSVIFVMTFSKKVCFFIIVNMEVGQADQLRLNSTPRAIQYIRLKDSDNGGIKNAASKRLCFPIYTSRLIILFFLLCDTLKLAATVSKIKKYIFFSIFGHSLKRQLRLEQDKNKKGVKLYYRLYSRVEKINK